MVRGFKNILFGGEGLFLATLTGPGHVWLQSMPILNLAEEIAAICRAPAATAARIPPRAARGRRRRSASPADCSAGCSAAAPTK